MDRIAPMESKYIVFDCAEPAYLDSSVARKTLVNTELGQSKKDEKSTVNGRSIVCDLPTNLWKENTARSRLVAYSPAKKKFSFISGLGEMRLILKLDSLKVNKHDLRQLNDSLIVSIFKLFHHPRFFYYSI